MFPNSIDSKVTIITIYHNRESGVIESISSLIHQSYKNIEIIIVDDFSSDNTYNLLSDKFGQIPNIKIVRNNENLGFTNSLINVLNTVDSKYAAIHGAGDISDINRIATQVDYLERNTDVGVVGTKLHNHKAEFKNVEVVSANELLVRNRLTHGTAMFKMDVYRKAGGYRSYFTFRQDKDLWYRIILISKIHVIPDKLYTLIKFQNSVSEQSAKSEIPTLLSCFASYLFKERLKTGTDSLDKYSEKAALLFNPTNCNKLLLRLIYLNSLNRKFDVCYEYSSFLLRFNRKSLLAPIFYGIRQFFKLIS
ncbi:glycosyltransferase family 2 protein [Flavihumibacter sp. UBA7668]|uniref:glycosyltransferase family 2 protein n=1 Tax=Flavihumibacter sp. UBA7668 TaxID=1946542 RepID=UPI0025C4EE7D|nr:glycosyltransferase family 2 protein [Flavihumibacter sp. UBA7668]